MEFEFNKGTGLLLIKCILSNLNGDPDLDNDPRHRPSDLGDIGYASGVSFKRKLRDLLHLRGPIFDHLVKTMKLDPNRFNVAITEDKDIRKQAQEVRDGIYIDKYWDARVFGSTFLDKGEKGSKGTCLTSTGVVQFGEAFSLAPIDIVRHTLTCKGQVEEDKERAMAPFGFRVVEWGLYAMPFFVNPSMAAKTKCSKQDIEVLKALIPFAYEHTASMIRSQCFLVKAWYVDHKTPLGNSSDKIVTALCPTRKPGFSGSAKSLDEFEIPEGLPKNLLEKVSSCKDLVA